ncbi:TetR/AcrR family transcriptional regulator [Alkalicoccobacillus plakortidis]|uniref:TetR/AcrR family transcriptional regulator n=1 Tax=Alkalicoccobacillus plakortidis TaxID=444060 RepID=A0ABT0XMQ1_9BACI|nr:TetR/AcrR family transcriptional regulator [Alkalicoccobacillus plakortidis]MCM2677184.1 TetR/AcrR family transcriptional regulator [Alkalicoccobacillus plakortidis]
MPLTYPYTANLKHILSQTEMLIKEHGCAHTTLKMIMEKAEVSKGAIYHYVKSKDELFGLMLQKNIAETNDSFWEILNSKCTDLSEPLKAITEGLTFFLNKEDVSNPIFIYLLGKNDNPAVEKVLDEFYQFSEKQASSWIQAGQEGGVIETSIDPKATASSFLAYSYGLRVTLMLSKERALNVKEQFYSYMLHVLSPKSSQKRTSQY